MTTTSISASQDLRLEQLIDQTLDFQTALHAALEELGERFGFYHILAKEGPLTAACLATQAGTSRAATRVWLDAQAARGCLKHCPGNGTYCLWSPWPGAVGKLS